MDLRAGWNTRERFKRVGSAWEGRRASALVKVPELGSKKAQILVSKRSLSNFRRRTVANSGMDGIFASSLKILTFLNSSGVPTFRASSSPGVRVRASQGTMPRENGVTRDGEDKGSTDFRRKLRGKMRNLHQTLHGASP